MGDPPPSTLDGLLERAWTEVCRGVESARHGFHQPSFVSNGLTGSPSVRIVVLRDADPDERTLLFHTDARSPKLAELRADPQCAWLLYDKELKLQVRINARAEVIQQGPIHARQWERSRASSRRCYLAPHAPSAALPDGPDPNLPDEVRNRVPDLSETEPGLAQFAVVRSTVHALDVLHLRHDGHERARYTWAADSAERVCAPAATWLAP
ncbi:MAG: pyridoxamine 5'-phosphate oxidase family protein [Planctomycetota bacterium]